MANTSWHWSTTESGRNVRHVEGADGGTAHLHWDGSTRNNAGDTTPAQGGATGYLGRMAVGLSTSPNQSPWD